MAIKLCLNSLYGKTVQSLGGDEENAPSCVCPYYGAAITANCRSRILDAAILDPYAIVAFMTDGIVSTRELKGLPRVKEVFDGDPPPGVQINLGDWEMERMAGGFFLQSGVYHIAHKSGKTKDKTRGADPRKFILKMDLKDLMFEKVLPIWKEPFDPERSYPTLEIAIRHYMTAGAACASKERFELIGRWCDVKRNVDIDGVGVKRKPVRNMPLYYSRSKIIGPIKIHKNHIRELASLCEITENEVYSALRSGEALRYRFLVPWLPADNPTPDILSKRSDPDWLNAIYEDETDSLNLTKEDRDTADIAMGWYQHG
jgi:hypothetical protein